MALPDQRVERIFTCWQPVLATEAQVALTRGTLGGQGTGEIAPAFLAPSRPSGWSGSRARSGPPSSRSRCRPSSCWPSGWPPCWWSSPWASTRATAAVASWRPRRCGWGGRWPVAQVQGPAAGLEIVDPPAPWRATTTSHATRGELLGRLGRTHQARQAYRRALRLVHHDAERRLLERRLAELDSVAGPEARPR
jgi:hypothetical protein